MRSLTGRPGIAINRMLTGKTRMKIDPTTGVNASDGGILINKNGIVLKNSQIIEFRDAAGNFMCYINVIEDMGDGDPALQFNTILSNGLLFDTPTIKLKAGVKVGPAGNTAQDMVFRTKAQNGTDILDHTFSPDDDEHGDLGKSGKNWKTLYVKDIVAAGTITGGGAPGGELGGTWDSPTVDATHSGSAHHAQAHNLDSHATRNHADLSSVGPDQHHAESHTLVSHPTKNHSDLDSIGADNHHYQDHASRHVGGGADTIAKMCQIVTGTYTGNDRLSESITGLGIAPKYVRIWPKGSGIGNISEIHETTTEIVDNNASGLAARLSDGGNQNWRTNTIISLDSDGFTVDDNGSNEHPNQNLQVYEYLALGT